MKKPIIISLGGSIIVPDEINVNFLKKFRKIILDYIEKGNRVIIVAGGGKICRRYDAAALKIFTKVSDTDLDWLGIAVTKLNAEFLRALFGRHAYEKVVDNPTKKVKTNKKILFGSGYLPGSSSDKDAVLLAKTFGAKTVINLTNVNYVYDKNPKKFKDAKPFKNLTWSEFRKIVGSKWDPGANWPFDPVAAKLAQKLKIKLIVCKGVNLLNFKKVLVGKKFVGTVIN